jgi:hypothetical protein
MTTATITTMVISETLQAGKSEELHDCYMQIQRSSLYPKIVKPTKTNSNQPSFSAFLTVSDKTNLS